MKQSNRLGTLIASGTGICGVTAIMATVPIIAETKFAIKFR